MNKELTQCEWVSTVNGDRCDNHGGYPRICTAVIIDLNAELRRQSQELERAREALAKIDIGTRFHSKMRKVEINAICSAALTQPAPEKL